MTVRAVPNGDERDKDVQNSIRYAVDNGAKVINMSFGKAVSPEKELVWEAFQYAKDKGVLLVKLPETRTKIFKKILIFLLILNLLKTKILSLTT